MLIVLYEDQQGPRNGFGFHRFVCQYVLDTRPALANDVYHLEKHVIFANPCKGNGNLRRKCRDDLPDLSQRLRKVFAVYDQDKLNTLLKLEGEQCRRTLRDKLAESCEPKSHLEIVLIKKNLESVIEIIRDSGHADFVSAERFAGALAKKLNHRDSLFNQCAQQPKTVRDKLLDVLPDIKRLVTKLVECCPMAGPQQ